MTEPRMFDAYRHARVIREGCTHRLGCRCAPPFWLREPTPAEQERYVKPSSVGAEP